MIFSSIKKLNVVDTRYGKAVVLFVHGYTNFPNLGFRAQVQTSTDLIKKQDSAFSTSVGISQVSIQSQTIILDFTNPVSISTETFAHMSKLCIKDK